TTLWLAGNADGGAAINATYEFWLAGPAENEIFDECVYLSKCTSGKGNPAQPMSAENRVVLPTQNRGPHLYLNASCAGVAEYKCPASIGDPNGYAAALYLYAADIKPEQNGGPTPRNLAAELAAA